MAALRRICVITLFGLGVIALLEPANGVARGEREQIRARTILHDDGSKT